MYNQMVVLHLDETDADLLFQALADQTRRDIVARVLASEQSVSELARGDLMSFAAVQKHVAVLERAGVVTQERRGREQIVHGNPERLRTAARMLDAYEKLWRGRADRIDQILAEQKKQPEKGTSS